MRQLHSRQSFRLAEREFLPFTRVMGDLSHVSEWMVASPVVVQSTTEALEAIALLRAGSFRHLPVVGSRGQLVGILSRSDLLAWERGRHSDAESKVRVGHLMTKNPVAIRENERIERAAELLIAKKISCLPVIDQDGLVIGVLTESDFVRGIAKGWRSSISCEPRL